MRPPLSITLLTISLVRTSNRAPCFWNNIAPWAKKCLEESRLGARIFLLTPASVGSNWFADYVHEKARVLFLSPRLSFDGANSYPKDIILSEFSKDAFVGYECWRWK